MISLEEVVKENKFYPRGIKNLKSMKDGKHFTQVTVYGKEISKFSYQSGQKVETLLNVTELGHPSLKSFGDYALSDDEKKILIYTGRERIYRRSFLADYFIYDREEGSLEALTEGKVQLATFSPDGKKLAFVRKNNIYVKDLESKKEYAITSDGRFNFIINYTINNQMEHISG